jgi:four helix bundle protein
MIFEDLESWQRARPLAREIYSLTRTEGLARDFGLSGQIQGAGVSVMSSIAEGFERQHLQEKLQCYNVAHGSNSEVRSLTYVIEDNYPSLAAKATDLREKILQTGRLVTGLIHSTESCKSRILNLSPLFHLISPF